MFGPNIDGMGEYSQWPWPSPGWQCPQCKRIYAPTTGECRHCNKQVERAENAAAEAKWREEHPDTAAGPRDGRGGSQ